MGIAVTAQKAAWRLVDSDGGVYEGAGNRTLTGVPSGLLTITWLPTDGFRVPDPAVETRTLESGGEVQFTGDYLAAELSVNFSAVPSSGVAPLTVQFRNRSTSPETAELQYRWYFGDGDTSSEAEPMHTYIKEGSYTVSLVATDFSKIKMETKKHFVAVGAGVPATGTAGLLAAAGLIGLTGALAFMRKRRGGRRAE